MSRVAIFDFGTVTCRLGVFDVEESHIREVIYKDNEICNLGTNVDASGALDNYAIERVISCAKRFAHKAKELEAEICICTLTSAARDASNSSVLLDALTRMSFKPQIIEGDLEARLSFLGVAQDFPDETIAVMDSGGGSTELCIGMLTSDGALDFRWVHSYNIGARRLTERFFNSSEPHSEEVRQDALADARCTYDQEHPEFSIEGIKLIGVGGTATSLVAIHEKMEVYDPQRVHLACLSLTAIDRLGCSLNGMANEDRKSVLGLQPKRSDVIVGGTCSVEALMQSYGIKEMIVSENDILCGLAVIANSTYNYEENVVKWNAQLFKL